MVGVLDEIHIPQLATVLSIHYVLPNVEAKSQLLCILKTPVFFFLYSLTSVMCLAPQVCEYSIPATIIMFCEFRGR